MKRGIKIAVFGVLGLVATIVVLLSTRIVEIKVELPPKEPVSAAAIGPVFVVLQPDGRMTVEGLPTTLETLPRDLAACFGSVPKDQQRVMIQAPNTLPYAHLTAVLNRLKEGGWTKIGLVKENPSTEAESNSSRDHGEH